MALLHAAIRRRPTVSPRLARIALFFLLFVTLTTHVSAQPGQDAAVQTDDVLRVHTDLVTVPVVVTDARGRRVAGLTRDEFELFDEGQRVEATHFASGAERVAMLFLLDASGSTRDILTHQRETALAIFTRFGPRSRVAAIHFRERPELVLPFTNDLKKARAAFRPEAIPNRLTAIFDAALASVRAFNAPPQDPSERRIVILISDGLDTASSTRAAAVINEANAAGVTFYVIHLPLYGVVDGRLGMRRPSKGFRELAEKTGGQYFVVGDAVSSLDPRAEYNLAPVFSAISDDLRGQYVLGYHAGEAQRDGRLRRVEVRLTKKDKRKLRARQLREGYSLKQ